MPTAALICDIRWGGVDITRVKWELLQYLGDEQKARLSEDKEPTGRLREFADAVRANRQLATRLRDQGMNEEADRFAYRAQLLQQQVFKRQHSFLRWLLWGFLRTLAGYGYKPLRTLGWLIILVVGFAGAYDFLGPMVGHTFSPVEALVFSGTSFLGRGFFSVPAELSTLLTGLAVAEGFCGLFIEVSFIATFTQRFFAR